MSTQGGARSGRDGKRGRPGSGRDAASMAPPSRPALGRARTTAFVGNHHHSVLPGERMSNLNAQRTKAKAAKAAWEGKVVAGGDNAIEL